MGQTRNLQPLSANAKYFDSSTRSGFSDFGFRSFQGQLNTINAINGLPDLLEDTHENRLASFPASSYADGSIFFETDRAVFYVDVAGTWKYASGVMQATQASLPTDLGAADAGFLVNVADYGHLLQWTGSIWEWGPGELGSGFIQSFLSAPSGNGWRLCDGSMVHRLNSNGTLTAVMLPNVGTGTYLKLGTAAVPGPNAASGQTAAITAGTPAGTVSQPTFTGTPDVSGDESADQAVQSGAGANVAAQNHTHTLTPTGTVSQPTFTGTPLATHSHGPGTLDLNNTVLLAYYRQ